MLDELRRIVRSYLTLTLDIWDRLAADPTSLFALLCFVVDNRQQRLNPVRFEWINWFPSVMADEDDATTLPGLDRLEYAVPMKGYEAFIEYNLINVGRPDTVAQIESMLRQIPAAFLLKQVETVMNVFRKNPLCMDGQNFFDTDHTKPSGLGTYSNIIAPNWADPAAPTILEADAAVDAIRARFATNATIQAQVIDDTQFDNQLAMIVHNETAFNMFHRLRTDDRIGTGSDTRDNTKKGSFRLLRDLHPTSGEENNFEAIFTGSTARPVILIPDSDPTPDAYVNNRVKNNHAAVGMRGSWGAKAGFPHVAVQGQPT
jgi:hypothetical protein